MEWPFDWDCSRNLLQQQMYQIYMCHCYRTVTFHISSCFSFHSQFKSQNTTWIHNFPNIYCAYIWFNVLKIPKLFYVILLTDNWWTWFLYLQNQFTISAARMGKSLAVFRIWNHSDLKQKKRKKLVIGYHVPPPLTSMVGCKNDSFSLKTTGSQKTMPGFVQGIDCFNMVVVFNIWQPWTKDEHKFKMER